MSISGPATLTDWTVGHVHSGALGWVGLVTFGSIYFLIPKLFGRAEMWSVRLINVHFWIATVGIVLYIAAMWIAGVMQGLMWRAVNPDGTLVYSFVESVKASFPFYLVRLIGGALYLAASSGIGLWFLWEAIATYRPLVSAKGEVFEITRLKLQVDDFICSLKNVVDRNKAESLKGTALFIARSQLPQDQLYLHDLVGVPVFDGEKPLGIVAGFENFGAGDLIDVKIEGRADTVLIPYNAAFVVEASKDRLVVNLPDDYLEEAKQP